MLSGQVFASMRVRACPYPQPHPTWRKVSQVIKYICMCIITHHSACDHVRVNNQLFQVSTNLKVSTPDSAQLWLGEYMYILMTTRIDQIIWPICKGVPLLVLDEEPSGLPENAPATHNWQRVAPAT